MTSSEKNFDSHKAVFPTEKLLQGASKHLLRFTTPPQKVMVQGKRCHLYDSDGKRYLDFVCGWGSNILGHCHPKITDAIAKQAQLLTNAGPGILNQQAIEFSLELTAATKMQRVYYCSTGAEANENAVKLARKYGNLHKNGANEILTFTGGFHGRTLAMMAATGKPGWKNMFPPSIEGFAHLNAATIKEVQKKTSANTVAVMLELIKGEGGVYPHDPRFIDDLRKYCTQHKILLIVDEVQTGMGRTGTLLASEHYKLQPDILTLGKSIGGGFPFAAMLAREELNIFQPGETGGTYGGQPLAVSAGRAVLDTLKNSDLLAHANKHSAMLKQKISMLPQKDKRLEISNIRGKGMMLGFDVVAGLAVDLMNACFEENLLVTAPRPDTIRILPPLVVNQRDIEEFITKFEVAYKKVLKGR